MGLHYKGQTVHFNKWKDLDSQIMEKFQKLTPAEQKEYLPQVYGYFLRPLLKAKLLELCANLSYARNYAEKAQSDAEKAHEQDPESSSEDLPETAAAAPKPLTNEDVMGLLFSLMC